MVLKGYQMEQYILEPVPRIPITCPLIYTNYQNKNNICQEYRLVYNTEYNTPMTNIANLKVESTMMVHNELRTT